MSGTDFAKEGVLRGVAKLLGLPDPGALADVKPSGLMRLTQRELLDVAKTLGLAKVSRLKKEALLARVWETLAEAGAVSGDLTSDAGGVPTLVTAPAEVTAVAPRPAPPPADPVPPAPRPEKPAPSASAGVSMAAPTTPAARTPAARPTPRAPLPAPAAKAPPRPAVPADTGPRPVDPGSPSPQDARESPPGAAHKFDVGQGAPPDLAALKAEIEKTIPWGYGKDRITAMPVDPDRLYAYWEVTDDAIAKARPALGPAGASAYPCLRLYDITGRIFDGTNAHHYSDHGIDRAQRQWFFHVGRPTSEAVIEIGLKSHEGFFVKVARSGRITFPRREPVGGGEPEWLTVRVGTGQIEGEGRGHAAVPGPGGLGTPHGGAWEPAHFGAFFPHGFPHEGQADIRRFLWGGRLDHGDGYTTFSHWEEVGPIEIDAEVTRSWSWQGDIEQESWSVGPFSYPVEMPGVVQQSYGGPARMFRNGPRTHVVWGPWQVVIKGIGATAQREVLGQWEVYRSWSVVGWPAGIDAGNDAGKAPVPRRVGASELRLGGSELRLGGASERYRIGASELRLGGASERSFIGASEWRWAGASERRFLGASELRFLGASERRMLGASELRFIGASEWRLGGASEARFLGASEHFLGASENRPPTSEGAPHREGAYPALPQD